MSYLCCLFMLSVEYVMNYLVKYLFILSVHYVVNCLVKYLLCPLCNEMLGEVFMYVECSV